MVDKPPPMQISKPGTNCRRNANATAASTKEGRQAHAMINAQVESKDPRESQSMCPAVETTPMAAKSKLNRVAVFIFILWAND